MATLWPAFAQRNLYQAEGEIARLLDDARASYDNLELDQAAEALDRAVRMGERFGARSRAMGDVYIQRGILVHVRDRNSEGAVADFVKAFQINPRAQLDPLVSTPSLERLFERARREAERKLRSAARAERLPPAVTQVTQGGASHTPPAQAQGGRPLPLKLKISAALNQRVYRVYAYFRSARINSVQKIELTPDGPNGFSAVIPARFVGGRNLSYYIVVEDRAGGTIHAERSAKNPYVVPVAGGYLDVGEGVPSGSSLDGLDKKPRTGRHYVTFDISFGTGGGFISEKAQPVRQKSADIRPGFAVAPLHALLELDFWATDWLALSAFSRLQIVEFTHLEGGRLKFKVIDKGPNQLLLRVGGGVGYVRHLVDLGDVLDTTLEGQFAYTLGATYVYQFSTDFGLLITPDFIHLIGTSPAPQLDLSIGVSMGF